MDESTPTVDRTTAVLSIRPVYADRILDGTKTIEFRRKPLPEGIETVLIWRTGRGGIVGRFDVQGSTTLPASLWETARGRGIDISALCDYAGGPDADVTGIYIGDVTPTIKAERFGWSAGPQAFRYAPTGWREVSW